MPKFIADKNRAQTLQLSNDAFYYIQFEEEPLDDSNLEEAEEIVAMFPNGFYIEEGWKAVDDTDLIEATFVPFVEASKSDYDESLAITKYTEVCIKWIEPGKKVKAWLMNSQTGKVTQLGECPIRTNEYKHKYFYTGNQAEEFTTGKMSMYFLKDFKASV